MTGRIVSVSGPVDNIRIQGTRTLNAFQRDLGITSVGFRADNMRVFVFRNREEMGAAAALAFEQNTESLVNEHGAFRGIFAAAPSQNDVYASLVQSKSFPWQAAEALFMMDEYTKLDPADPRTFKYYHNTHLWGPLLSAGRAVNPQIIYQLDGLAADVQLECLRYTGLLTAGVSPVIIEGGYGEENVHIAFNDPPDASFTDPFLVKYIELAMAAKLQQVHEGHYKSVEELPDALTLSVPALTVNPYYKVSYWSSVVPTANKATAVYRAIFEPISEAFPGTALRSSDMVAKASLFVDMESSHLVREALSRLGVDFSSLERSPRGTVIPQQPTSRFTNGEGPTQTGGGTRGPLNGRDMG